MLHGSIQVVDVGDDVVWGLSLQWGPGAEPLLGSSMCKAVQTLNAFCIPDSPFCLHLCTWTFWICEKKSVTLLHLQTAVGDTASHLLPWIRCCILLRYF